MIRKGRKVGESWSWKDTKNIAICFACASWWWWYIWRIHGLRSEDTDDSTNHDNERRSRSQPIKRVRARRGLDAVGAVKTPSVFIQYPHHTPLTLCHIHAPSYYVPSNYSPSLSAFTCQASRAWARRGSCGHFWTRFGWV